jgi:mannose/fructose/N-acetylgalactosamine-specific phosphotransferase system component IID
MNDETFILALGLILLTVFGVTALSLGYDGDLAGTIIFVIASAIGVAIPRPWFLRG